MWSSLFKNKDSYSMAKNSLFHNYLLQSQYKSIKNIIEKKTTPSFINPFLKQDLNENFNEEDILKKYLDKIKISIITNQKNSSFLELNNNGCDPLNKYYPTFLYNPIFFLLAFSTITSSIGFYLYLQYTK